jgi:E3 Ubiquitin ligase
VDRFEPGAAAGVVRYRGFELPVIGMRGLPNRRTLGYHFKEEVLPLGRAVYVLGTATDRDGSLAVARSQESHDPFLVSLKTRDHVVRAARQTYAYALYGTFACVALGLLVLIVGIVYGR